MTRRDELHVDITLTRIELIDELRTQLNACVEFAIEQLRDDDEIEIDDIVEIIDTFKRVDDNAHDIVNIVTHYETLTSRYDD